MTAETDIARTVVLHDSESTDGQRRVARRIVTIGLLFGVIGVYLAIIGLLLMLHGRPIIVDVISLGQATLAAIGLGAGITIARLGRGEARASLLLQSVLAGAIAGAVIGVLTIIMGTIDLRQIFIALSRPLGKMLTFGYGQPLGPLLLILAGALSAGLGTLLSWLPAVGRRVLIVGVTSVIVAGVFQELIQIMLQAGALIGAFRDMLYSWDGLGVQGAVIVFVAACAITTLLALFSGRKRKAATPRTRAEQGRRQAISLVLVFIALVILPLVAGSYIGQVMMLVGLYILMGMGLNLEIGLAGLLDLGFVAFFAVGAYTTALLTADSPHSLAAWTVIPHMSYWGAMPIAVAMSVIVGVLFGVPVLGVRGDYLAVATMGLGEIVRVIVLSDFAAPLLGGAQGVLQIPRPSIFGYELSGPVQLFYLTLVASTVAAYFAWRLENSRLGRAWMALRDDEDVAQALGINLVRSKLLAYGLGAAFAGMAGSIFATMVASVYPSSFQLLISINVLALIIIGGMGSLPGVIVGAATLVGLPELLREFGEYRYLFYGAVLIIMMRIRPEGLWPSPVRRRELHSDDQMLAMEEPETSLAFATQGDD
jgi:branched-chain amino acid transport system permease protein